MSFKTDLARGKIGETLYYEAHGGKLERLDGKHGDFRCPKTGEVTELKTDFWSVSATPNYFFEHIANKEKNTPGGPWQAQAHGATEFVYFYVSDLVFYKFKTDELVNALEGIIHDMKPTSIKNATYTTEGYRVPRDKLAHLASEHTIKVKVGKP